MSSDTPTNDDVEQHNERRHKVAEEMREELEEFQTEPMKGGIAIDLVTRQAVFVRRKKYGDLVEHKMAEGYSLAEYKMHPYLGVDLDDAVYEVVYVDGNPQNAHKGGKTYDMPRSRLCTVPVHKAWNDD